MLKKYLIIVSILITIISCYNKENRLLNKYLIPMINVKSGIFLIGNDKGLNNEKPIHKVEISNDYLISKYEITVKDYCEVMNWALQRRYVIIKREISINIFDLKNLIIFNKKIVGSFNKKKYLTIKKHRFVKPLDVKIKGIFIYPEFKRENRPIVNVTWYGAIAFCNYLSLMNNLEPVYNLKTWECNWNKNGYRLPTEAEWEFAAKGGNESKGYIYSGSDNPDEVGHYFKNNDVKDTINVNCLKPNELGLYNMSGNAMEWCWDWFEEYSAKYIIDPKGMSKGQEKIYKGGAWNFPELAMTPSSRFKSNPNISNFNKGFRIAKNVD